MSKILGFAVCVAMVAMLGACKECKDKKCADKAKDAACAPDKVSCAVDKVCDPDKVSCDDTADADNAVGEAVE
jgi:hypothetical protein